MPKERATLLEVIPKRGEMYQIWQFSPLSKQNVNNPCYPESRSQIPRRACFLGSRAGLSLCVLPLAALRSPSLRGDIPTFHVCGRKKTETNKYFSHPKPTERGMHTTGIRLVIWPHPLGTLTKLFPRVDSLGAAKF